MSDFAEFLRKAAAEAADGPDMPGGVASVSSVFAEEPVSLTRFVQGSDFLDNPPLSDVQYEAVRHIERIYLPETYDMLARDLEGGKKDGTLHVGPMSSWRDELYWSHPVRMTNFITLQWGKGSGKDHVVRIASMRIAYLLMVLANPQRYFSMPPQDTIHLLNVASSSGQAQQAFFMPITRAVKRGWFKGRCQPKQNVISYQGNIESISGHSDAESQEGLNLMLGIADEIDAFKSAKEFTIRKGQSVREPTKSAEAILEMMRSSGSTRFPKTFKQVRISFPRYLGSTIQRLTAEAKEDLKENSITSRHYVSGPLATWLVNPRVEGKEAFAADYKDDPVMARSKYECRPSRAINPYFRNRMALDACFVEREQMPVQVDYIIESTGGIDADGRSAREVWTPQYHFADDFYPVRGAVYSMHGDLAVQGDRAGIAMAHVTHYSEHTTSTLDPDGAAHEFSEMRPHVKVDFFISYTADISATPPREIQIRWGRQLCFELIQRGFNIRRFTFDGFQSTDSMQILEAKGIESERVSTDLHEDPWRNLRDLTSEGRISIPRPIRTDQKPSFLLRDELLSLTKLPNGRVDHPADGSKDEADAVACAVLGAIKLGGSEDDSGDRAHYTEAQFSVHRGFAMPMGLGNPRSMWETEIPSLF